MHTHSFADYVACLVRGDIAGIGDLMLSSAFKLHAAGADFLTCPDNTIQQAMDQVAGRSRFRGCTSRKSLPPKLPPRATGGLPCSERHGSWKAMSTR